MGGAGWLNLIPKLPDFAGEGLSYGIFRKMRDDYASQVRHLRRREYQDMMFSMKQAGLNPMLAAGAQPNHASGYMGGGGGGGGGGSAGVGTAIAANTSAKASMTEAEAKTEAVKSQVNLNEQSVKESQKNVELAEQKRLESAQATAESAARAAYMNEQSLTEASKRAELEANARRAGADEARLRAEKIRIEKETPPIYGDVTGNPAGSVLSVIGNAWEYGKGKYQQAKPYLKEGGKAAIKGAETAARWAERTYDERFSREAARKQEAAKQRWR